MAHPTRRTLTAVVVAAAVGFGAPAAGCSDSGDEITVDPTTTSGSTTTTASTTTTTESTTTESTPTTLDDEAAIRELHTRFMTEMWNENESYDDERERSRQLAVDPILTRALETFDSYEATGKRLENPNYVSNIVEIAIEADRARVVDCSLDPGVLYDADGNVLVPGDDFYKLRESEMRKIDGQWFVVDLYVGGDQQCEPDA